MTISERSSKLPLCGIVLMYLILSGASAWTLRPWCDEAWFFSPARNLVDKGYMGTSVLDPTSTFRSVNLTGIDHYTYWIMPLYLVTQAGFYEVAGASLASMRVLSMLWGLVALLAWYGIVKKLGTGREAALLAAALLAIDFQFAWSSSAGRMDIMAEALAASGLYAYLWTRDRSLLAAMVSGHALVAAAVFTHPLMIMAWAGLIFMTLYLDYRRLRWFYWPVAATPYLAAAFAWWLYIRKAPEVFLLQFGGNASNRWEFLASPLTALWQELTRRYLETYGVGGQMALTSRTKVLVLVVYLGGAALCMLMRDLRRRQGVRLLLGLLLLFVLLLPVLDSLRQVFYLVHILPLLAGLAGIGLWQAWRQGGKMRWLAGGAVAILVAVQLLIAASRFRSDAYHQDFGAAADVLRPEADTANLVMASAEWAFVLGFDGKVVDDWRLGYRSGKRPDLIVMDVNRYQEWISHLPEQDPGNFAYIQALLRNYRVSYQNKGYTIYQRRP